METEGDLAIYYAAHNEYIEQQARIMVVGITPGWQQMERSICVARQKLMQGLSLEEVAHQTKNECRLWLRQRMTTEESYA